MIWLKGAWVSKFSWVKEQIFILNDDFLMILFINFYVSFFLLLIKIIIINSNNRPI